MKFDLDKFINEKIAINCETKEEVKERAYKEALEEIK